MSMCKIARVFMVWKKQRGERVGGVKREEEEEGEGLKPRTEALNSPR